MNVLLGVPVFRVPVIDLARSHLVLVNVLLSLRGHGVSTVMLAVF
jgi:hypothetical protein